MNQNPKFNIINFFFPPFSEIELVSLFYLLFLSLIHRWDLLLSIIFETSRTSALGIVAVMVGVLVFVNAFSTRTISQTEKQIFSISFYLLLSFITMYSLISPNTSRTNNSIIDEIELFIFIYLFFKSFLRIMILRFSTKQTKNDISNQMTNKQLRVSELIMIILFAPVLYLLLQANNSFAQVLCLSYFYLTTMINISSRVIRKYSRVIRKYSIVH